MLLLKEEAFTHGSIDLLSATFSQLVEAHWGSHFKICRQSCGAETSTSEAQRGFSIRAQPIHATDVLLKTESMRNIQIYAHSNNSHSSQRAPE